MSQLGPLIYLETLCYAHDSEDRALECDESTFATAGATRTHLAVPGIDSPTEDMVEGISNLEEADG